MVDFVRGADDGAYSITGLSTSEASATIRSSNGGFLAGAVAVVDGGGTGFNAGTTTVQVSLDGNNWFTAKDISGTDMAFTADAYFEFSLAAPRMRVLNDGSVSDVDVRIYLQ